MSYLTDYYTTGFASWVDGEHGSQWKPHEKIHAISAIKIARLTDTTSILPTAFYELSTIAAADVVLRGHTSRDGSVQRLSDDDIELYLGMRSTLLTANARCAFLLFKSQSGECQNDPTLHSPCLQFIKAVLEQTGLGMLPHKIASVTVLDSWIANVTNYRSSRGRTPSPCSKCRTHLEERDWELREQAWRKLPQYLGITVENWKTSD